MSEHLDYELTALIDGELEGDELARAEAHLASCAECRETLEDLRRLVRRAGALDDRAPGRDLWAGISQRIISEPTADVVPLDSRRRRISLSMPQLAAAAVVLMALSVAAGSMLRDSGTATQTAAVSTTPRPDGDVIVVNNPVGRAVESYESAIADLEQTVAASRGSLDTATVRVLQQSLVTIDSAIAQANAALKRDPANLYLNGTLQRALDRKLSVLRQVTSLTVAS